MNNKYDVIIVGGGVVGAAIFNRLTRQATSKILLIEKSRFGQGSTGWSGGIIRCYHPDSTLADMACEGDQYYRQFEQRTGFACSYHECGFLYFIYPNQEEYARKEVVRLSEKIAIRWLTKQEAVSQFPTIRWDDLAGAVYEPNAGYMDPVEVSKAWINSARINGGTALEGVKFKGLITMNDKLAGIQTNYGPYYASSVVMCVGAWANKLAASAHLSLPETIHAKAIQLNAFRPSVEVTNHPAFIDPIYGLYGRADGRQHIYLGCPVPEWGIDPDIPCEPALSHMTLSHDLAQRRFQWAKATQSVGGLRRFDGYTENERGVIVSSNCPEGLIWATGFSGGGFKLAPAIASQVQKLLT
jgi:sarcosine oxidase, subunit beta